VIAPVIKTGTFGVAPQDAGVASATVTVGQQLGASIGTSLLNTIFAAAVTSYLTPHLTAARLIGRQALTGLALAHGYDTAFWWTAGIFADGALVGGVLLRPGRWFTRTRRPRHKARCQRHKPGRAPIIRRNPAVPGLLIMTSSSSRTWTCTWHATASRRTPATAPGSSVTPGSRSSGSSTSPARPLCCTAGPRTAAACTRPYSARVPRTP
jgi:hypothetical protein